MKNPIICVDFDGVINSYKSGWTGVSDLPDEPVHGAIEWLMQHLPVPDSICAMAHPYEGPEVQIYSSRSKSWFGRRAMKRWLVKHGLHPAYIADNILKFPSKKPAAFLTIDDRAICFNGRFPTAQEMLAFKPWHKLKLGATNKYPYGKISTDDEGEIRLAVGHDRDFVHVQFGKPIAWLSLPSSEAKELGSLLLNHAKEVDR